MPIIGGDIAAMQATAARFVGTGAETSAHGAHVSSFAKLQQPEYERLAAALVGHIQAQAAECRSEAGAMRAAFEATEWFGSAQANVGAAEAELQAALNRVLDDAGSTAEEFKARLAGFVAEFEQQALSGRLVPAMESLRQTYDGLATVTRHVADGFAQVDSSVRMA